MKNLVDIIVHPCCQEAREMPSSTKKTKLITKRKATKSGARRKREIRHDYNVKVQEVGRMLGLDTPDALANKTE